MESPYPELFETCTESLCHPIHLIQIIWKSCRTSVRANTPWSRIFGPSTEFLCDRICIPEFLEYGKMLLGASKPKHRFQNFWKFPKALCDAKLLIQIFLKSHRTSARPKSPIPDFLENAQNHRLTESPYPEVSETSTESLCHLDHLIQNIWNKIWKSRRTSVRPNTPGPEFLDQTHRRISVLPNTDSRISGTWGNVIFKIPELLERAQKLYATQSCTPQNTDSRFSGKCTKSLSDGKPLSRTI